MRLLKRDSAGGVSFTKDLPESEIPSYRYAILSHTWGKDEEEVTYQDILDGIGTTKPGIGSAKVRFCVERTKQDGLEYFWNDTCCIDKRNLVELDRSLRSMYRWYANAETCYAFISDLPKSEQSEELKAGWGAELCSSRWFQRGWTLQELIAPPVVEFFSRDGARLGTKATLEEHINQVTRIPIAALRGKSMAEFSVQERRQWQEGRQTREPEDLVYSLLGILDISMPVLYGEGKRLAWERLELAITTSRKGARHKDFSLAFSLAGAAVETPNFVARNIELQEMRDNLISDGSRKTVVLHGLGGIGKTQLAIAYAMRHRADYSALLWLNIKDRSAAGQSFVQMAKQILREHPNAPRLASSDLDEIIDGVKSWLSTPMNTRWLMICDNYDNPKVPGNPDTAALELRRYLPEAHQGSVIVTSRSSEVKMGYYMRIRKLEDLKDGLKILEHSSVRADLVHDAGALRLAEKLNGLPLALATAGAYLSQSTVTFDEYLHFFEKSWARLQRQSPALMTYEDRTLYSTWQISYEQIKQRNNVSANLLRLWACFDNQDLWYELLCHLRKEKYEWMQELVTDKLGFEACMRVLCNYALVEANNENAYGVESKGYGVHTCVHAWMRAVLRTEDDIDFDRVALECVANHVPAKNKPDWTLMQRRLLAHASRCVEELSQETRTSRDLSREYLKLGFLNADQGRLKEAEEMYLRILKGGEEGFGPEDNTLAFGTIQRLGHLYAQQGRMKEAEGMHMQALEWKEGALGLKHTSTLSTMNDLGVLYNAQGRVKDAETMYLRAFKGSKEELGPKHRLTLSVVNNLGLLYERQGRRRKAEEMYILALIGKEEAWGPEHTSTLDTAHNLGLLYANQGRKNEAEGMYARALAGYDKAWGPKHRSTLGTVYNLGNLYYEQRRTIEARKMYTRAADGYANLEGDHEVYISYIRQQLLRLDQEDSTRSPTPPAEIARAAPVGTKHAPPAETTHAPPAETTHAPPSEATRAQYMARSGPSEFMMSKRTNMEGGRTQERGWLLSWLR